MALDPKLAEVHAAQSQLFPAAGLAGAEAALAKALMLNPNLSDALIRQAGTLGGAGRLRESLAVLQRVDAIDPLNVANLTRLNGALRDSGNLTDAQAVTARLLHAFPDNPQSSWAQASDLLDAGHLAEARERVVHDRAARRADAQVAFGACFWRNAPDALQPRVELDRSPLCPAPTR